MLRYFTVWILQRSLLSCGFCPSPFRVYVCLWRKCNTALSKCKNVKEVITIMTLKKKRVIFLNDLKSLSDLCIALIGCIIWPFRWWLMLNSFWGAKWYFFPLVKFWKLKSFCGFYPGGPAILPAMWNKWQSGTNPHTHTHTCAQAKRTKAHHILFLWSASQPDTATATDPWSACASAC